MGFKYRDLEQFAEILGDDSFDYVSSGRTIDSIAEKIKALPHPTQRRDGRGERQSDEILSGKH